MIMKVCYNCEMRRGVGKLVHEAVVQIFEQDL